MGVLTLPANIKQRAVRIVNASTKKSITEDITAATGLFDTNVFADLAIDESKTPFLLSSEAIVIDVNNTEGRPFQGLAAKGGRIATAAQAVYEGYTAIRDDSSFGSKWNPWFTNIPAWENTTVKVMELRFSFRLGQYGLWNATKEVVMPIIALMLPVLPREVGAFTMVGPYPSLISLLVAMGKTGWAALGSYGQLSARGDAEQMSLAASISDALVRSVAPYVYNISIGNIMTLQYAYMKQGKVSLSTEIDQHGMPISGEVSLMVEGLVPPSTSYRDGVPAALRFGGNF